MENQRAKTVNSITVVREGDIKKSATSCMLYTHNPHGLEAEEKEHRGLKASLGYAANSDSDYMRRRRRCGGGRE